MKPYLITGVFVIFLIALFNIFMFLTSRTSECKDSVQQSIFDNWSEQDYLFLSLTFELLTDAELEHTNEIVKSLWTPLLERILSVEYNERTRPTKHLRVAFLGRTTSGVLIGRDYDFRRQVMDYTGIRVTWTEQKNLWDKFVKLSNREDVDTIEPKMFHCNYSTEGFVFKRWIYCMDKIFITTMIQWQADIILWPPDYNEKHAAVLEEYDIIISTDDKTILPMPTYTKKQIRLFMPSEPDIFDSLNDILSQRHDFCSVALNPYVFKSRIYKTIPFWWHYNVQDFHKIFGIVSAQQRFYSKTVFIYEQYQKIPTVTDWFKKYNYTIFVVAKNDITVGKFLNLLSQSTYNIVPFVKRKSAGQPIIDSSVFGVPTFSFSHKFMQRLTQPTFCLWSTEEELIKKLDLLENNLELYTKLVENVFDRIKYFDTEYLESPLQLFRRIKTVSNDSRCYL